MRRRCKQHWAPTVPRLSHRETPRINGPQGPAAVQIGLSCPVATVQPYQAKAFGTEGHRLVATLAERQFSDGTPSEVARLLAIEPVRYVGLDFDICC